MSAVATPEVISIDDNDDDDEIDEDQLQEYREELEALGRHPDKVAINALSMVADDYSDSKSAARKIYHAIRQRLLNLTTESSILTVIYVLDSILKNCKGCYIPLVEEDAVNWMPVVYGKLDSVHQQKLQKVWRIWDETKLFHQGKWKAMGRCFSDSNSNTTISSVNAPVAGISRTKDGNLILSPSLRREMQNILDDMQNGIQNELDKVSLERLAGIDPALLQNIKTAAEDSLAVANSSTAKSNSVEPTFLSETRSEASIQRSKEWNALSQFDTEEVIGALRKLVSDGVAGNTLYTQSDALKMTDYFATATTVTELLSSTLEKNNDRSINTNQKSRPTASFAVNSAEFTNEGIKKRNGAVIALLYEIGLPFRSTSDGRRFRTQLELSNHLDAVFKRNQVEKSMITTQERGWYSWDTIWTGEVSPQENDHRASLQDTVSSSVDDDPSTRMVVADETRDRCVICGLPFRMVFHNEDGVFKYSNCIEIEVMNDDAAAVASEQQFVHVTCWKGLGEPETLNADQTLQEDLRHSE